VGNHVWINHDRADSFCVTYVPISNATQSNKPITIIHQKTLKAISNVITHPKLYLDFNSWDPTRTSDYVWDVAEAKKGIIKHWLIQKPGWGCWQKEWLEFDDIVHLAHCEYDQSDSQQMWKFVKRKTYREILQRSK